jgi:uncharacterized DUF497 family protein
VIFLIDEPKRLANLAKHGWDLEDAVTEFDWTNAIVTAARENRMKAVVFYDKRPAVVVFKMLGTEATSLISFRPAGAKERKLLK